MALQIPNIPKALEEAAQQICPNVDVRILDGHNIKLGELARAASDIALSLVDCLNIRTSTSRSYGSWITCSS